MIHKVNMVSPQCPPFVHSFFVICSMCKCWSFHFVLRRSICIHVHVRISLSVLSNLHECGKFILIVVCIYFIVNLYATYEYASMHIILTYYTHLDSKPPSKRNRENTRLHRTSLSKRKVKRELYYNRSLNEGNKYTHSRWWVLHFKSRSCPSILVVVHLVRLRSPVPRTRDDLTRLKLARGFSGQTWVALGWLGEWWRGFGRG